MLRDADFARRGEEWKLEVTPGGAQASAEWPQDQAPAGVTGGIARIAVKAVGEKFETELRGSYEILDAGNRRIKRVEFPSDRQVENNRRRDYFIAPLIQIPPDAGKGLYTLQITVEDVKGQKSSQASIEFRVR